MEEITRNCSPARPDSGGPSQAQTEYNNNDQTLTPKSKAGSTVGSGRKSRASRAGALSVTPKKASGTPIRSASVVSMMSDTSQQFVKSVRLNLLTHLSSPKSNISPANQKNLSFGNLKVWFRHFLFLVLVI